MLSVLGVLKDIHKKIVVPCYDSGIKGKAMKEGLEFAQRKLDYLNKYIGSKPWVCGDLTFADFVLWEELQILFVITKGQIFQKYGAGLSNFSRLFNNFNVIP